MKKEDSYAKVGKSDIVHECILIQSKLATLYADLVCMQDVNWLKLCVREALENLILIGDNRCNMVNKVNGIRCALVEGHEGMCRLTIYRYQLPEDMENIEVSGL